MKKEIFSLVEKYFAVKDEDEFIPGESIIGVGFPCFDHNEVNNAIDSLLELRISQGEKVKYFEEKYSEYVGTKYGVAVNSGSSANLIALASLLQTNKVMAGSEVIVPSATFATVLSPIIQLGLKPVFVDIEPNSYNIDPREIEKAITKNTGLIMPVHSLGLSADIEKIMKIANENDLCVFEDCCEAHGAKVNERVVGSFGDLSAYSFFVAHNMTSGEGGMVMTDNEDLYQSLLSIREFGRYKGVSQGGLRFSYSDEYLQDYDERYIFETIGYNVRMSDIHASLGIEQLKKLDEFNKKRVENANKYNEALKKYDDYIKLPEHPEEYYHSFYGYTLVVKQDAPFRRVDIVRYLEDKNIETRAFMGGSLIKQPAFRKENMRIVGNMKETENILNNAFFIGCHPKIGNEQIDYVIDIFEKFFELFLHSSS